MAFGLTESEIEDIWEKVLAGSQINPSRFTSSKKESIVKLTNILINLKQHGQLPQMDGLQTKDKQFLTSFFQSKIRHEKLDVNWKVRIIVGNNYVQKSLHPLVEFTIGEKKFEFDVESISKTRLCLSNALLSTEKSA